MTDPAAADAANAAYSAEEAVPAWARSIGTLDLSRLADRFKSELDRDASRALAAFRHMCASLPMPLRPIFGRLVEGRLAFLDRVSLRRSPAGRLFLRQRANERFHFRPRIPAQPYWTNRLAYDIYASLLLTHGSEPARRALLADELVLLSLRRESWTLARKGLGSYDDVVVVFNGRGYLRRVVTFPICTEPGAQYSQRASPAPPPSPATRRSTAIDLSAPKSAVKLRLDERYNDVKYAHNEGEDINQDGIRDAGRLIAGTYQYFEKPKGHLGARAFKVRETQVVERDTDGDGYFTAFDPDRIDPKGAGMSMYIHKGGLSNVKEPNTWSAGCQTIPGNVYNRFLSVMGKPKGFYYVLVNTVLV